MITTIDERKYLLLVSIVLTLGEYDITNKHVLQQFRPPPH